MSSAHPRARTVAQSLGVAARRRIVLAVVTVMLAVIAPWTLIAGCGPRSIADSTSELQAQFDALPPGGSLTLEPRTYLHSGVLSVRVPGVRIDGNGATLQATNDATSAVKLAADNIELSNLTLAAPTQGERYSNVDQHKLLINGNGINVSRVSVSGSAAAGIFVQGAHGFRITDVNISGSRADGLHITGGSTDGVVTNVRTDQTGDDGVAVVSYQKDPAPNADIQINGATVSSTRWGRGISVVGGNNVTVQGFSVANTSSAGVYVATEGAPYFTRPAQSVRVAGGSVTNANTDPGVVQGAVLVTADTPAAAVQDVQIADVTISNTPASAEKDLGLVANGPVGRIRLDNIHINGSSVEPFFTNAPEGSYQVSGWTLDGQPYSFD